MNIEDVFEPNGTTLDNLKELAVRESDICELRISEISELADACVIFSSKLYRSGMGIYEILSIISESVSLACDKTLSSDSLYENRERLIGFLKASSSADRAVFCDLYVKKMNECGFLISESDFLPTAIKPDTFVYVKNPFSDEAYDVFSQNFTDPRLRYAQTLKDAVRAVTNREVSYCLLPLEERGGARLPTVAELIFGNDLKINSVTPVFGMDGSADMKYALLSKDFFVPDVAKDDDRYLEIRLKTDGTMPLAELFNAAEFYGIKPYRVNTISFYTDDGQSPHFSIVLRDEGRDFSALLTYLTLFSSTFVPVGIYRNLD